MDNEEAGPSSAPKEPVQNARRQKYKELLDIGGICGEQSDSTDVVTTLKSIMKIVNISNRMNKEAQVKNQAESASEVVIDAQVIKMSHELMRTAIQKMGQIEFSDEEYFNVLNNCIGHGVTWPKLTKIAVSVVKNVKYSQSMFGAYRHEQEIQQKVRKERKKYKKSQLAEEKKPETVARLQKEQKSAQKLNLVLKQVNQLYQQTKQPIPYYCLIIDPENFMNTVDNAFQFSFLFRDGTICLEQDEYDLPAVRPVSKDETLRQTDTTYQCISSLTPSFCEEMIKQYEITESFLKINREPLTQ